MAKSHGRWRMVANSPSAVGHAESKLGELVAVRDTIELSGGGREPAGGVRWEVLGGSRADDEVLGPFGLVAEFGRPCRGGSAIGLM